MSKRYQEAKISRQNLKREFQGPLFPLTDKPYPGYGDLTIKEYCNLHKNHLRAYLHGYDYFHYKGQIFKVLKEWMKK